MSKYQEIKKEYSTIYVHKKTGNKVKIVNKSKYSVEIIYLKTNALKTLTVEAFRNNFEPET